MGKALLTFEALRTEPHEIQCTLNSRPLTYVNEDFDNILTPNHLIYGCDDTRNILTIVLRQT